MTPRIVAGVAWVLLGLALIAWAVWGAATTSYISSELVATLTLQAAYAILVVAVGATMIKGSGQHVLLLRVGAGLTLVYAGAWLLFGGVDDAPHYAFPLVMLVVLSLYTLYLARRPGSAA